MGAVARSVLDNGGKAKGIVPEPMFTHGSKQICETVIVPDMHTRKKTMGDLVSVTRVINVQLTDKQKRATRLWFFQADMGQWKRCWR